MKKVIFIAAALFALAACNKEVINAPVSEVGYLSFDISADDIVVETKATVTNLDSYSVYVGSTSYNYGTQIKNKVIEKTPGTYAIYAENITPAAAHVGNGALRLASETKNITVTAGGTTTESLVCKAVNAKIDVNFEDSFKNAFSSWSVTLGYENDDTRDLTTNAESESFFYNIDASKPDLTLDLTATPKSNGAAKTNSTKITLQAGYHYTINYSAGANGYVGITVTADDSLIDAEDETVTVNPYN